MLDAAINLRALPQQRDLLDQVFFSLDDVKFRQFTALLNGSVSPNSGLERLLAVKAPWSGVSIYS